MTKTLIYSLCLLMVLFMPDTNCYGKSKSISKVYYIDSNSGDDNADGQSLVSAWKSIQKIQLTKLFPGDTIKFRRGSAFDIPLFIYDSGEENNPIVLTDYGEKALPAPAFTNKVFEQDNFANCIRIKGSYVVVENLYFHETSAYVGGNYTTDGGWAVWEMGAIYIDKGAKYCVVQNNEIRDCLAGIKSYGEYALIKNNYIHDCNRVLAEWNWGPIGIWFGADNQEACYNRIFNYRAEDPRIHWAGDDGGGGADGGAFEVDDARYPKYNIKIHHNYTRDCQGFIEVTWTDVLQNPNYENFQIHHNISDDYQAFTAVWRGKNFQIENNTIVRRKKNSNDWGVFNITGTNTYNKIRNNIIITEGNIPIFNTGIKNVSKPNNIIENNLYYAATGTITLGKEGPGTNLVQGNPLFVNYDRLEYTGDFALMKGSPAIDKGKDLGYNSDFMNKPVPMGGAPDIGAIEYDPVSSVTERNKSETLIYSSNGTIIINNYDQHKQAVIYNMLGMMIRRINLVGGKNYINMPEKQVCIVGLENGVRAIIR
ncbi:MAG: choice-of-anchor Q domain-containing protein [Paludibacter sp.]|nr:choice-of-anchor Q domain-containing protein [Paludibacter sp.]